MGMTVRQLLLVIGTLGAVHLWPCDTACSMADDSLARRSRSYDVVHYKLALAFREEERRVVGTTWITLTPLRSRLDSIVLDAVALDVDSVILAGGPMLRFSTGPATLTIQLPHARSYGDTLTVAIGYSCAPTKGLYFLRPDSTDPKRHWQIWTQGQETENRHWFPCYDYPNDKATSEVIATVRDDYVAVSNGALMEVTEDHVNRTHTFHWRQAKPHSSYLIMIAAGDYAVLHDRYRTLPLTYYVYKDRAEDARRVFQKTPVMMEFFEKTIGYAYPWEKLAQIIIDDFMWGGMENTSAITLNTVTLLDPRAVLDFSSDDLIAHEIAHQWWGDLVTFRDWRDLWLSEGFADYFEAEFKEYDKGRDEFQYERMESARRVLRAEETLGRKPIVSHDSYMTNLYAKGSWVLHMMREMMGREVFERGLRAYVEAFAFRSADSHEFQLAMEDATGWNLEWFFEQWVYKAGHPELEVTRSWDEDGKLLTLGIRQTQQRDSLCGLFRFPLDIECTTSTGKSVSSLWVDRAEQSVTISLLEEPRMVIIDKGQKVLKSLVMERSVNELVYQLGHAEDVNDRVDAARELREYKNNGQAFKALSGAALRDRFWGVRYEATMSVGVMDDAGREDTLFSIYSDPDSRVRNAAVTALDRMGGARTSKFLQRAAETDSSYLVVASCIRSLSVVDSARGVELALRCIDSDSYRDVIRRACLWVLEQIGDPRALASGTKYAAVGYPVDIRLLALRILVENGKEDPASRALMFRFLGDGNKHIRSAAARGLGEWKRAERRRILQQRMEVEQDPDVREAIERALRMDASRPTD